MDKTMVLLALLLLVSPASAFDFEAELDDCINSMQFMTPCQKTSLEGGTPTKDCCGSYKIMKRYWPLCICAFLRETTVRSSDYYSKHHADLFQAAQICGVPEVVTDCPAILGLPPNSDEAKMFELENTHVNVSSSLKASKGDSNLKTYGLGSMVSLMGAVAWMIA